MVLSNSLNFYFPMRKSPLTKFLSPYYIYYLSISGTISEFVLLTVAFLLFRFLNSERGMKNGRKNWDLL